MKKNFKNACAKTLALVLAAGMVSSVIPAASADAKAKKPKLSTTKVSVKVGKTKKVTVKNVKAKKVTWTVKSKKIATLSKKTKKSVVIKGKKKGTTTVTAKIKVGKKTYKKTVKVTVTKKTVTPTAAPTAKVNPTTAPTTAPTTKASATPTAPTSSKAPEATATAPAGDATESPAPEATATVAPTKNPDAYVTALPFVTIDESNEATGTKGKTDYRSDVEWDTTAHSVTFTNNKGYNGGLMLNLNPEDGSAVDVSAYDFVKVDVETNDEVMMKLMTDSTSIWTGANDGFFEGAGKTGRRTVYIDITSLKKARKALAAIDVTAKGVNEAGESTPSEITVYSIEFTTTGGDAPEATATAPAGDATAAPTATAPVSGGAATATPEVSATPEATEAPTVIDLTSDLVVASINTSNATGSSATAVPEGIKYTVGEKGAMFMLNFSQYLSTNSIKLSEYSAMNVTWNGYTADGTLIDLSTVYEKLALVTIDSLHGYDSSDLVNSNYKNFPNAVIDLKDYDTTHFIEAEDMDTAAGLNFQLNNAAANNVAYIVVSSITLTK